jgi:hypothetical protein
MYRWFAEKKLRFQILVVLSDFTVVSVLMLMIVLMKNECSRGRECSHGRKCPHGECSDQGLLGFDAAIWRTQLLLSSTSQKKKLK